MGLNSVQLDYDLRSKVLKSERKKSKKKTDSSDRTFEYYFREVMGPGW